MSLRVLAPSKDFRARVVIPLPRPVVDVVVPVHDEEARVGPGIRELAAYLAAQLPFSSVITIADRASNDETRAAAQRLASELPNVRLLRISEQGRGRALAAAWLTSVARIVAGMDLSTSPSLLLSVVAPLISGRSEVSIGRGLTALRATAARRLVPEVLNRNRFFATELLVRARLAGLRIQQAG